MKKNMLCTCAALSVAWCFLAAVASAAEFTWTGGGSGWADGANWGGTAPGAGDTAVIPSNFDVKVTDGDVATVGALGAIRVEGSLVFLNTSSDVTIAGNISGAGAITSQGASGITLAGDNIGHTGKMEFTNSNVTVTSRTGLGSPTREAVHSKVGSTNYRLWFTGNGLTNDVPLRLSGDHISTKGNGLTQNNTDPFVQNADMTFGPGYVNFSLGNYTFNGALKRTVNAWFTMYNSAAFNGQVQFGGATYFPVALSSSYTLTLGAAGNSWAHFCAYGAGTVRCNVANALDSSHYHGLGYNGTDAVTTLDLNGYDQTVPVVRLSTYSSWVRTATEGSSYYQRITSDRPATLTMTRTTTTGALDAVVPYKFEGAVTLRHAGEGLYKIVNTASTSTGRVEVTAGTVAFDWGASWAGDVDVTGGAVQFLGMSYLSPSSRVSVSGTGKLYIGENMVLECAALTLGGESKGIGTYSAATDGDWIDGPGSISISPAFSPGGRFVWTGATGNGSLRDGGNWEGGTAPRLTGGDTLVFKNDAAGNVATVASGNVAAYGIEFETGGDFALDLGTSVFYLGPGGITTRLAEGATGVPTNMVTAAMHVSFPQDGDWTVAGGTALRLAGSMSGGVTSHPFHNIVGDGALILEGDNEALLEPLKLVCPARVLSPYGLGSALRTTVISNTLKFAEAGLTNYTPITLRVKNISNVADSFTDSMYDPLVMKGAVGWLSAGFVQFYSGMRYAFDGGFGPKGSPVFQSPANAELYITNAPIKMSASSSSAYVVLWSNLTTHLGATGGNWSYLASGKLLVCEAEDALYSAGTGNAAGCVQTSSDIYSYERGTIDLNGFDQRVQRLARYLINASHPAVTKTSALSDVPGTIRSAKPALFRIMRATGVEDPYPVVFAEKAGLEQAGGATNQIVRRLSSTVGPLKVSAGELVLKWGAGFTNVEDVVVSGGRLLVAADSVANAFGVGKVTKANVAISGDGVLELESGLAYAASLTVDGVAKGCGFYGASACADPRVPAANRLSCMAGEGVLRVGKIGTMMVIR